jgi:hypothetical protein
MYLMTALCFVTFTTAMLLGLIWLGWQNHRAQARREKARRIMRDLMIPLPGPGMAGSSTRGTPRGLLGRIPE